MFPFLQQRFCFLQEYLCTPSKKCLERGFHRTALCDLLAAGVAPARLYWLQTEIGCIGLGRAKCTDEQPNRERVLGFVDIASWTCTSAEIRKSSRAP